MGSTTTAYTSADGVLKVGNNDLNTSRFGGYATDIRVTTGVARYTGTFDEPAEALPQGAAVAASTGLPTTGVLSLAELLQASYVAVAPRSKHTPVSYTHLTLPTKRIV